jgi:hypothetical protein
MSMSLMRRWVARQGGQLTRRRLRVTVKPLRRNAPRSFRRATQQRDAARAQGAHQRGADRGPLQIVVDHVPTHDQVVGVRLDPVAAMVPVTADGAGRGEAVAAAVPADRGEGTRLAVEEGHARPQAAADDADQADPAAEVEDVAIPQALGAEALHDVGSQADPRGPDAAPVRPRRQLQKPHRRHLLDGDGPDRIERERA